MITKEVITTIFIISSRQYVARTQLYKILLLDLELPGRPYWQMKVIIRITPVNWDPIDMKF